MTGPDFGTEPTEAENPSAITLLQAYTKHDKFDTVKYDIVKMLRLLVLLKLIPGRLNKTTA